MSQPTRCPEVIPFGDSALLLRWGGPDREWLPLLLWRHLQIGMPAGVIEAIPATNSLLVVYDPEQMDGNRLRLQLNEMIESLLSVERSNEQDAEHLAGVTGREIRIPVVYGGEAGPDLDAVAQACGLTVDEVIERHSGRWYRVTMLGFTPGFAYLGHLDAALQVPRRQVPRRLVPAGSVGIAGLHTGIYPQAGPGGWQIIGRTPELLFFPGADPPTLLAPGDRVRFMAVRDAAWPVDIEPVVPLPECPVFRVLQGGWLTSIQDAGRFGRQAYGIAPAGAMDLAALVRANRLVGNLPGAAALEATGQGPVLSILRRARAAVVGGEFGLHLNGRKLDGETGFELGPGDTLTIGKALTGWRCYLAVAGGFEAPLLWGSRGTHLRAGQGGPAGRALRPGDVLGRNSADAAGHALPAAFCPNPVRWREVLRQTVKTVRFMADERLAGGLLQIRHQVSGALEYAVLADSDRMGLRLKGQPLLLQQGLTMVSHGVPHGAIQVDGEGQLLILLCERGTTGGYPCLGAVILADHWLLGQLRPGDRVRLQPVTARDAQSLRAPPALRPEALAELAAMAGAACLELVTYTSGRQHVHMNLSGQTHVSARG